MRTTVTLEDDVEQQLKRLMRQRDLGFKAALNEALRRGLASPDEGATPFQLEARPLGLRAGIDPLRFNALVDDLEVDAHRASNADESD